MQLQSANANSTTVCGVDEVGRGPLAGPVYAACVVLNPVHTIDGLADSKQLSEKQRNILTIEIKRHALAWTVAFASVEEIDRLNILQASLLAMQRAVQSLPCTPGLALVDGKHGPQINCKVQTIVNGDQLIPAISAASILAKTARDAEMLRLHHIYPQYGFDRHKGYPTKAHFAALQLHDPCAIHRQSFAPVKNIIRNKSKENPPI